MRPTELEQLIEHCLNIYRTVEEDKDGRRKGKWIRKEGKPDHLFHAMAYWRIAILKTLEGGGSVVDPLDIAPSAKISETINPVTQQSDYRIDLDQIAKNQDGSNNDVVGG
jgi:hypothetical protein